MDAKRQIKYGAVISYAGLFIGIIISILYTPWMVSVIGKSNYALYTLATSFISLFMVDFGLSSTATRFIAKYRAESEQDKINEFVVTIEKLYILIDIVIIIVLAVAYIFIDKIYAGLTPNEIHIFRSLYLIVAMYSIVSFPCLPFGGILNAYEKFIQAKLCDLFYKVASVLIVVVALLLGGGVTSIVIANAVTGLVTTIIRIVLIRHCTGIRIKKTPTNWELLKEIASFSIWVTVMSLAQRCIFNLAPTILGMVSTSSEIAVFAPANALEGYFFMFSSAVNGLFLATVSRLIAKQEDDKIVNLMIKVGRYQLGVMGLIFIGFLCVGKDFMIAWMGVDFVKAWPCALLIFIPDILIFTQQIANTTAIAKNKVKQQAIGYIIMAVVCLSMSFVLCKYIGVIGTAISIAVSYFCLFVYMNILYKKLLRIDITRFFKECYGSFVIPMALSGILGYYVSNHFVTVQGWSAVLIKATIVCIIYCIFISFALSKEEKTMIASIIMNKLIKRGK